MLVERSRDQRLPHVHVRRRERLRPVAGREAKHDRRANQVGRPQRALEEHALREGALPKAFSDDADDDLVALLGGYGVPVERLRRLGEGRAAGGRKQVEVAPRPVLELLHPPVVLQGGQGALEPGTPALVSRRAEDGRQALRKIFVEGKFITSGDFDLCWVTPDLSMAPTGVNEPFIQLLADKGIMPVEKSLKILSDRSRVAFLPLEKYDIDIDLSRNFPAEICQRWCVLPFDRMSKSILVATANPFNQHAAKELAAATQNRLLWYLTTPVELVKNVRKTFR